MSRNLRALAAFAVSGLMCLSVSCNGGLVTPPPAKSNPSPPPPPSATNNFVVATKSLPTATVSVGFRASASASGGTPPYVWRVSSGSLPEGLFLDETRGIITGIPATAGSSSFQLQAQDSAGLTTVGSLTLTVAAGSWVTTYYVDALTGKDTNSGTSESSPWRTIAKVNAARFVPGDRILFKSGEVWREQLAPPSSGTSSQRILISTYGGSAPATISGADLIPANAWARCSSCAANVWQAAVKTQPNVVMFNGHAGKYEASPGQISAATEWHWTDGLLYVWSSSNPGSVYSGPGIEAGSRQLGIGFFGISFVSVQNLQFTGINGLPTNGAVYSQASPNEGESSHDLDFSQVTVLNSAGDGIHLEDCNNCLVENSTVSGMARAGIMLVSNHPQFPVTAGAMLGNTVSNNHFDGISTYGCAIGENCEGDVQSHGVFFSGLIISQNTVHDNGAGIYIHWTNDSSVLENSSYSNKDTAARGEGYGIGVEASSNNTFEKNLLYSNRTRGIEFSNDEGAGTKLTGASNNLIRYNAIHDNGDHGIFTNDAPTQGNRFLYNVVWNHPNGECFIANGTGHVFYGNTCWNNSTGVDLYTSSSTPVTANISVKNNIFAKNLTRAVHIESGVTIDSLAFDYNDYDGGSAEPFLSPSGSAGMHAWQSLGLDKHSLSVEPLFVSASPVGPADLVLKAGSSLATSGTNLGLPLAIGLSGPSSWPSNVQTTAQGSEWSMGAFPQKP